ncbi:MAG: DUF6502 family protein [Pseudomonadota bacterium]
MSSEAADYRVALLAAFADLLMPLVRICLEAGVSSEDVEKTVQQAFVRSAYGHLEANEETATQVIGQIAAITGVSSADIPALLKASTNVDDAGNQPALMSILSAWEKRAEYQGAYGVPLDLPIRSSEGVSFTKLVEDHGLGISCDDALAKLESRKRIQKIEEDTVRHVWNFVVHEASAVDFARHIRRAFVRLGNTISHNFNAGENDRKRLEQVQYSDVGLTRGQYEEFEQRFREKIEELFKWSDSWTGSVGRENEIRKARGENLLEAEIWPGIGVYQFNDSPEEAPGNPYNKSSKAKK